MLFCAVACRATELPRALSPSKEGGANLSGAVGRRTIVFREGADAGAPSGGGGGGAASRPADGGGEAGGAVEGEPSLTGLS